MKKLILFVSTTLLALTISAQALVKGGQFKDRILPMQGSVTKSDGQTIWGASGVQERFLDNGAEPKNSSIFTIIRDGENNRNYIYNPSSKTFIAYESEWKASSTNAFVIPDIASSASLSKAYIIRGGAGANTYLNAKGGTATHTDFAAYNGTDANSQWSFEECTNQTYTFDVTDVNTGLAEFLATASLIEDATIIPGSTSIRNICTEQDKTNSCIFSVSGQMLRALQKGINIVNGRKVLVY